MEIGSCVLRYLKFQNASNTEDLEVIFCSDNYCGQQQNKFVLAAYSYAVRTLKIRSITHKFLIHGHSQNEGDNVHSVVEKQVKRHLKSCPIYVPDQYVTLIRAAKKNGPPYHVYHLIFEDFYDLKALQEEWGHNFTADTDKTKVKWQDIKVLKVEKEHPMKT